MSDKTKDPSEGEISEELEEVEASAENKEEAEKSDANDASGVDGDADVVKAKGTKKKSADKKAEKTEKSAKKPSAAPQEAVSGFEAKRAAIEGIFNPGKADLDVSSLREVSSEYDVTPKSGTVKSVAFIGGLLVILLGSMVVTGRTGDVISVIRGDYLEKKIAETRLAEEQHRQAQLDALDLYGTLILSGQPWDALIRLNGQVQYGQTSSGEWRELRLGASTPFQNLKVKETQTFEVSAAGHHPQTYEVTQGMWEQVSGTMDYRYNLTASLTPASERDHQEFNLRMESDLENDYEGVIKITTVPAGAKVIFNNNPLLDKDGNELVTPVTFDRNWVRNEAGKLEEQLARVDTPPDNGHKIQLQFPDDESMPKYVTQLQRRMWTCEWKDEDEVKKLGANATLLHQCNYTWNLDMDFNALKQYIEAREAEEQRILEQAKELQAGSAEAAGSEKG